MDNRLDKSIISYVRFPEAGNATDFIRQCPYS